MNDYAKCPFCGENDAEKVGFTWWGGVLGPKILTHVKCLKCGKKYNGKTGKSNTVGITIYSIAALLLVVIIYFVIAVMRGRY